MVARGLLKNIFSSVLVLALTGVASYTLVLGTLVLGALVIAASAALALVVDSTATLMSGSYSC